MSVNESGSGVATAHHLVPSVHAEAQRRVLAKAIAEFSHERLMTPQQTSTAAATEPNRWVLELASGVQYSFTATRLRGQHWVIQPASIMRRPAQADPYTASDALCVSQFVLDATDELNITDDLLGCYLEELNSTVAALCYSLTKPHISSAELVTASFQEREATMNLGHPIFVATSGRIGFSSTEHGQYSPEAAQPVYPVWLAVLESAAQCSFDPQLVASYDQLVPPAIQSRWVERAAQLGLHCADYLLMPVHPWQWNHKITITFAPDIATMRIVFVGPDPAAHQSQQSIRTLYNTDTDNAPYVKMSLSIQNMGFMRGMSPKYVHPAPTICAWVSDHLSRDEWLRTSGFKIMREFASAGYTGDIFHQAQPGSDRTKMLAALWRENPHTLIKPTESVCTMAALLHVDNDGKSFAAALIAASGQSAQDWVRSYVKAYVIPVVHLLAVHRMAFMPHGENIIMVLNNSVPHSVLLKDIAEEVVVGDPELAVPDGAERIVHNLEDSDLAQCFHTDVVDGFLRHLAGLLHTSGTLRDSEFWAIVRTEIQAHTHAYPQVKALDLLAAKVDLSCLNRLQLRNTKTMVDLTDPVGSLMYAGSITNPVSER